MKRSTVVLFLGGGGAAFQPVLGRPLAAYTFDAVCETEPDAVVVISGPDPAGRQDWPGLLEGAKKGTSVFWLADEKPSREPRQAVLRAIVTARNLLQKYPDCDIVAVPADRPYLRNQTLKALLRAHRIKGSSLTFLSGPGEVGLTDILALRAADVFPLLGPKPALRGPTSYDDLALRLTRAGKLVGYYECPDAGAAIPVDDSPAVARAARDLRRRKNDALARRGVVFLDPATAWIDWDVRIGPRTVVYPSVVIEGPTRIGPDGTICPYVHIMGSHLGPRVKVLTSTVMEGAVIESDAQVGPFSRLRPKTRVRAGAKVGNFVEMKNTDFGPGSKAQHLSYLGDSTVGEGVNVGAGTITCNYDGVSKNPTRIDAGAFIGSGTELVAPVTVGRGAYVAAGSTITKNVTAGALAIARARQLEKSAWVLERARTRKTARARGGR